MKNGTLAPLVRFEGVARRFGDTVAVDGVTLDIAEGEFFALLGPSGCGKTTLMRMLAGFEAPDEGRILLAGKDIGALPPHRRPVHMMFQSYALFPHLSVARNIAFGLRQQRMGKAEIEARVEEMLALVRMQGLGERKPDQLSGGQRQRVALARAIAPKPAILLLDEPMAALDRKLREETQLELMALQRRLGMTFMIVTHDQDEAMVVADRMAVMRSGRIEQVGAPRELYHDPATRFVASFIGAPTMNFFPAEIAGGRMRVGDYVFASPVRGAPDGRVELGVRPERLAFASSGITAVVDVVEPLGADTLVSVKIGDSSAIVRVQGDYAGMPEERVALVFDPANAILLDPASGLRVREA